MEQWTGSPVMAPDHILTATVGMIDGIVFGRKAYDLGAAFRPTAHDTPRAQP